MTETANHRATAFSVFHRLLLVTVALVLLALLVAASILSPDPRGLGTHQQFGLPPCTFKVMFDMPCPSCGMTTSWAHLVRGQLLGAFRANVGGTLLGMLAIVAVPWFLISAARGRWLRWTPSMTVIACVASGIVVVTLVNWGFRILQGLPLSP